MSEATAIEARITGRVQGVSFRVWTQRQAQARGLTGWVRNEPDGTVRAWIEGPRDMVQGMLATLHEGPSVARVDRVDSSEAAPEGFEGFEIRR
ncbi:acylphosphatase [Roseovarius pacificus]|uniref:Acylphosphatase n=1 Tax=Roseovarius pacificus TaxID=337701 RepID=A0A1M7CZ51_9RHOB|nr:acylphosphatase [Roseovarius pacificus]GGO56288.1 acylphosphatase [Roseovarius pacificus]SHL72571.1 acylphosphatase [Roseovarius pacificus]